MECSNKVDEWKIFVINEDFYLHLENAGIFVERELAR